VLVFFFSVEALVLLAEMILQDVKKHIMNVKMNIPLEVLKLKIIVYMIDIE
jgi:hypothetical protein